MTSRDLGHGVSIAPFGDDGWRVASRRLALPWTSRSGTHPGATVIWLGEPYEVVAEEQCGADRGWVLQPWSDPNVMRTVFQLDEAWIEAYAVAGADHRRRRAIYLSSLPLAPLLALAPARLQRQWHEQWGFPATGATLVSAVFELLAGGIGVVQLLALTFGSDWFLASPLRWLAVIGPVLSAEALVRLATTAAGEPIGSVVGVPLALLFPTPSAPPQSTRHVVHFEDVESGVLEVFSDAIRRDWELDGVLAYRGRPYRLVALEKAGPRWRYRFERAGDEADGPRLRLAETRRRTEAATMSRPPSVIRTTVVTAVMCMSPRRYQELWARRLGVRPVWFTLLGAGAELVGGWINLEGGAGGGRSSTLAVNLFFLVEGVARLALLVSTGRPVGSVLGWFARPLLGRVMREEGNEGTRE